MHNKNNFETTSTTTTKTKSTINPKTNNINNKNSDRSTNKIIKNKTEFNKPKISVNDMDDMKNNKDSNDDDANKEKNNSNNQHETNSTYSDEVDDFDLNDQKFAMSRNKYRNNKRTSLRDDDNEEEDEESLAKSRVSRFLSIIELPPEVLQLQLANTVPYPYSLEEEDETQTLKPDIKTVNPLPSPSLVHRSKSDILDDEVEKKRKEKSRIRHYENGSGIPQHVKAKIIMSILKDLDVDKSISRYLEPDIVSIKLDPQYINIFTYRFTHTLINNLHLNLNLTKLK